MMCKNIILTFFLLFILCFCQAQNKNNTITFFFGQDSISTYKLNRSKIEFAKNYSKKRFFYTVMSKYSSEELFNVNMYINPKHLKKGIFYFKPIKNVRSEVFIDSGIHDISDYYRIVKGKLEISKIEKGFISGTLEFGVYKDLYEYPRKKKFMYTDSALKFRIKVNFKNATHKETE